MPAKRGINLRSGDLAEQLGLLILQNIALVAPIPRTEDVGVDAVVTLLEDHNQYTYIATDSFFLQIKSKSSNVIIYKPDEIKWLFDLELPFFIGRVDRSEQSIDLYCCHRISEAYLGDKDRQENLIINFEEHNVNDYIITGSTVSVGPPVLSICLSECELEDKRDEFIKLCKSHIIAEKFNLQHRKLGLIHSITWEKGAEVNINAVLPFKLAPKENIQGVANILSHSNPYIVSLASESLKNWDASGLEKVIKELGIVRDCINNSEKEDSVFETKTYVLSKGDEVHEGKNVVFSCGGGDSVTPFDAKEFFSGKKDKN
jgi:hypothetical protein